MHGTVVVLEYCLHTYSEFSRVLGDSEFIRILLVSSELESTKDSKSCFQNAVSQTPLVVTDNRNAAAEMKEMQESAARSTFVRRQSALAKAAMAIVDPTLCTVCLLHTLQLEACPTLDAAPICQGCHVQAQELHHSCWLCSSIAGTPRHEFGTQ
jgi:hypothetical protein